MSNDRATLSRIRRIEQLFEQYKENDAFPIIFSSEAPLFPTTKAIWYDTDDGTVSIQYGSSSGPIWIAIIDNPFNFDMLVDSLLAGDNITLDTDVLGETITINADAEEQVQSDWNQVDTEEVDYIKNKPAIPSDVSDLSDTTGLLFSGDYDDLDNKPNLSQLHTQNTDTILDEDGTNEVSAQEIREHIGSAGIHFAINDTTASTLSVYSSDKVGTLLSGKQNSLGFTPTQKLTASITIAVADWSGGTTCTKAVAGLLVTDTVLPIIDAANRQLIADFAIKTVTISAGELNFTAETTPDEEITFTIDILSGDALGGGVVWFGGVSGGGGGLDKTFQTLTEAATITFNAATSVNGSVTLTASRILGNITNAVAGEIHCVKVTQGGSGSYVLTYGNQYKFSGGVLPVLSATVGAVDLLFFLAVSTSEFHFINANFDVKTP